MKLDNIGWNRRTKKKRSEKGKDVYEKGENGWNKHFLTFASFEIIWSQNIFTQKFTATEFFEFITGMRIVTFLQGAPMSLRKYSRENQMMQIVSVIASRGLSFESDDDGGGDDGDDQDHVTVGCPPRQPRWWARW